MFLIYLVVPIIEIYLLFLASKAMGFFPVLGLVVLTAWIGSKLVKSQGLYVLSQFRERMSQGHLPKREMVEGLLVLAAGILLIAPGFISDAFGLLCLLPLTRPMIGRIVARWIEGQVQKGQIKVYSSINFGSSGFPPRSQSGNPFKVSEVRDVTPEEPREAPKHLN